MIDRRGHRFTMALLFGAIVLFSVSVMGVTALSVDGNTGEPAVSQSTSVDESSDSVQQMETQSDNQTTTEYELTIKIGDGGGVGIDPPGLIVGSNINEWSRTYTEGTEVEVTADAFPEFFFDEWGGDIPSGEKESASITITMDKDREINTSFVGKPEGVVVYDLQNYTRLNTGESASSVGKNISKSSINSSRIFGSDDRNRIFNPKEGHSRYGDITDSIVQISLENTTDEERFGSCSGSVISDFHVLTAAHCVYPINGIDGIPWTLYPIIDKMTVSPAADSYNDTEIVEPFSAIDVRLSRVYASYHNNSASDRVLESREDDLALLTLNRSIGEYLTTINISSYSTGSEIYEEVDVAGYPGDIPGTGSETGFNESQPYPSLWYDNNSASAGFSIYLGKCNPILPTCDGRELAFRADASNGQSGGPLLISDSGAWKAVGVLSGSQGSNFPFTVNNVGPRITSQKESDINTWISEDQDPDPVYVNPPTDYPEFVHEDVRWTNETGHSLNLPQSDEVLIAGEEITINHTVRNIGTGTANTVDIGYYLNTTCGQGSSTKWLGNNSISGPDPFNSTNISLSGTVPSTVSGDLELCMEIDPTDEVTEFDQFDGEYDTQNRTVTVLDPAKLNLTIDDVDGNAGGVDSPRPVNVLLSIDYQNNIYTGPVTEKRLNITVGNQSVAGNVSIAETQPGTHLLSFVPPTQPAAEDYDLNVTFAGAAEDSRPSAITYGEGATTQVATSLQIDRSGSMSGIISEAKEGASTFVQQATDQDYISVVSYSTDSRIDQDLVRLNNSRQSVLDAINGLSSGGVTNIGDAMIDGLSTLDTAPNGTVQAGVLLTDGQRNEGPSRSFILNNIVPDYNSQDVCLYTIGFTSGADEAFMQDIADAADCGGYRFAGESGEVGSIQDTLQAVFQDIAGEIGGLETIVVENGTLDPGETATSEFDVDDTVTQTTASLQLEGANLTDSSSGDGTAIVQTTDVSPAEIDEISLIRPDGSEVNGTDPKVNSSIVGSSLIYRIDDPVAGEWSYEINNTEQDPSEYGAEITADAQATLEAGTTGETYYTGGETELTATLVGPNGGVSDATVTANVTTPAGSTTNITLEETVSGSYAGAVTVSTNGTYTAAVTARNGSLSRTETISWTVEETPPLSVTQDGSPAILQGRSGAFNLSINQSGTTAIQPSNQDTALIGISDLTAVNGSETIPESQIELDPQSVVLADDPNVTATINVPPEVAPGEYRGTVQVFRAVGGVVTEQVNLTVIKPATFEVSILDTNSPIDQGESLNITAEVTNTGNLTGDQQVEFVVSRVGNETTRITLGAGEATTVAFSIVTGDGDAGQYSGTVVSANDTSGAPVEVVGPARFTVELNTESTQNRAGDGGEISINATVSNVGDKQDEQTIELLTPAGDVAATEKVQLAADEAQSVEFNYQATTADDGRAVAVSSNNDTSPIPLTVPASVFDVGDVGMTNSINIVDAVLIQQQLAGLEPEPIEPVLADVDRDSEVTIVDAVLIQQYLAGIIDKGELSVTELTVQGSLADDTTKPVDRTVPSDPLREGAEESETELIIADLENDGGLGKLQETELRIAANESELDDPSTAIAAPVIELAPDDASTVAFVIPGDRLSEDDWVGVYTSDDSRKIQLSDAD